MGRNKAVMPFNGQPLIERILARVGSLANEILIVANQPDDFIHLGLPILPDLLPGKGALGGLYTALSAAHYPFAAVIACDMPFVSPQLVRLELELADREEMDVVLPVSSSGPEPLHAVYRPAACLKPVERALSAGQMRMISWMGEVKVRKINSEELLDWDIDERAFLNVNTPEEIAAAEALER